MFGMVFERQGKAGPQEGKRLSDVCRHGLSRNQDRLRATQSLDVVRSGAEIVRPVDAMTRRRLCGITNFVGAHQVSQYVAQVDFQNVRAAHFGERKDRLPIGPSPYRPLLSLDRPPPLHEARMVDRDVTSFCGVA